jgi:hypothetical protein
MLLHGVSRLQEDGEASLKGFTHFFSSLTSEVRFCLWHFTKV